jgi:glutathione S-transferase
MPPVLYAHPFSSYCQKVLIALYENATPFEYRSLEDLAANAELAAIWPLKRFPVLVNEGRTIMETSTIIEYLQIHQPGPVRLIPEGDAGIEARMLDRVFDNYIMTPMRKIVADQLRREADRDSFGVTEARGFLDRIFMHGLTSASLAAHGFAVGAFRRLRSTPESAADVDRSRASPGGAMSSPRLARWLTRVSAPEDRRADMLGEPRSARPRGSCAAWGCAPSASSRAWRARPSAREAQLSAARPR